jgi:hypothetical protein
MRPRVRLAVIGAALLVTGGLMMANSVWTLPLVAVGAAMVVTAWIGHRLDGRVVLEWGQDGTELAFRAKLNPPRSDREQTSVTSAAASQPIPPRELPSRAAEVIEGEAHTVEIDVEELKALIAAAETTIDRMHGSTEAGPDVRVFDNRDRGPESGP